MERSASVGSVHRGEDWRRRRHRCSHPCGRALSREPGVGEEAGCHPGLRQAYRPRSSRGNGRSTEVTNAKAQGIRQGEGAAREAADPSPYGPQPLGTDPRVSARFGMVLAAALSGPGYGEARPAVRKPAGRRGRDGRTPVSLPRSASCIPRNRAAWNPRERRATGELGEGHLISTSSPKGTDLWSRAKEDPNYFDHCIGWRFLVPQGMATRASRMVGS